MGSPAGALARGLRRDAPAPGVAGADIVVVGVLRYEVVDAVAGAIAPVVVAIAAAGLSCTVAASARAPVGPPTAPNSAYSSSAARRRKPWERG